VRQIAADLGLPFLDTSALAADDSLWLPGDGHFSPAGAQRMAEMVAERLRLGQ
jgi:lysophospholipase L1-like esterase